jgi:hypothetical protein
MSAVRPWAKVFKRLPVAERTDDQGRIFDSRAEMARFHDLEFQERQGIIRNLRRQIRYPFDIMVAGQHRVTIKTSGRDGRSGQIAKITIDHQYEERDQSGAWLRVYEEFKGFDQPVDRLRRAVFESLYRVRVRVVRSPGKRATTRKGNTRAVAPRTPRQSSLF